MLGATYESTSEMKIVTPPVAKFGRSLGACLSFWRGEAALQPLHVIEVNVEDTVIGQFGAVERGDDSGRLVPLEVGYFVDQPQVRVGIVLLESRRVLGGPYRTVTVTIWNLHLLAAVSSRQVGTLGMSDSFEARFHWP